MAHWCSKVSRFLLLLAITGLLLVLSGCGLFKSQPTAEQPPRPDTTQQEVKEPTEKEPEQTDSMVRAQQRRDSLNRLYPRQQLDTVRIAMILPVFAERSLDTFDLSSRKQRISTIAQEFYLGARMALDSLKGCGMNIQVRLYDSRNDSFRVKAIREKLKRDSADLIIGPLFSEHVKRISRHAKQTKTNLISPLASVAQCLRQNPYYIAMEPGKDVIARRVAELVHQKFQDANFYVVRKYAKRERQIAMRMDSLVDTGRLRSYQKLALEENQWNTARIFRDTLSPERNVVFIPSEDESFTTSAISGIKGVDTVYPIDSIYNDGADTAKTPHDIQKEVTVIGLQDWLGFSSMDGSMMEQFRIHVLSDYHMNYDNLTTADFVRRYRRINHDEPNKYAIKGYDFTLLLGKLIDTYGAYFQRDWEGLTLDGLHTRFSFRQEADQRGWQNYYLEQLIFRDYELRQVNR